MYFLFYVEQTRKTCLNPQKRFSFCQRDAGMLRYENQVKLNKNQDVKIAGMIQKLVGTELRHELEGFAIDIMGELGTLYQDSPNLRDGGSWQIAYMYFLGLIIGGGTSQIQKNIISERGLGMPKEPKVQQGA